MSIWTSAPGGDECTGAEIGLPETDIYKGTGPQTLELDVATARSYHSNYRLTIFDRANKRGGVDVDVLLDRENLERLREMIDWALAWQGWAGTSQE